MSEILSWMHAFPWLWIVLAVVVGIPLFILFTGFVRYIPNSRVGIIEKRVSRKGSIRSGGIMAMNGEAGYQPEILRGGWHFFTPFQYRIHKTHLVTIPQGKIGYIFARDGIPLPPTQTLASNVHANDFQDVVVFLQKGGQRGPQRQILREGTYAINLVQFVVLTEDELYYLPLDDHEEAVFQRMADVIRERDGFRPVIIRGSDDLVAVVTIHDGPSLPQDEIIAPIMGNDPADPATYHNNFQDADRFLLAKGRRGRQLQVLVEGTYYLNRLFATIEMIPKTVIDVGSVGVVVSYTGQMGTDISGDNYKHGELVSVGTRGVWSVPLLPGKYAFNTYAGRVIQVPTTNFILKWISTEVGMHNYDENLKEVSLITKDAFEPSLPLSVVVHIDYKKAPLVVQRFGDIKRLVEQTLDPMVSAYFKNVGQTRTLIQLLQDRSNIQEVASLEMKTRFAHYNLELEEVLIGTPTSPRRGTGTEVNSIETILAQLRARQIAQEQVVTYGFQQTAAITERDLRDAEARAKAQQVLTDSEISIAVQANEGKAAYQRSVQEASRIRALAEAEAERKARIGIAEAIAIEEQVRAYGGPQFQVVQEVLTRFATAVEHAHIDVVPKIMINNGGTGTGGAASTGNAFEALLAMLLSDKLGSQDWVHKQTAPRDPAMEAHSRQVKAEVLRSVSTQQHIEKTEK